MDRLIDPEKHYISPGGYELIFDNDKSIQFDFNDYEGAVRKEGPTILDFIMRNLDEDSIEQIPESQFGKDNVIYNLAGQRLVKMQKGINIVNGKKIFIR